MGVADRLLECRRSVRILSAGMEDFGRQASSKDFTFSVCLDETVDQQGFFDNCGVKSLISKTLDGYAAPGHSHRFSAVSFCCKPCQHISSCFQKCSMSKS